MSERKWKMTESGAAVYSTKTPATPLPAPDHGAARVLAAIEDVPDHATLTAFWMYQIPEDVVEGDERDLKGITIADLRRALSGAGEAEPVAWMRDDGTAIPLFIPPDFVTPLYTHPAPAARVTGEMVTEAMVERGARAIADLAGFTDLGWEKLEAKYRDDFLAHSRAILTAALSEGRTNG